MTTKAKTQAEALNRATSSQSVRNEAIVVDSFAARGIAATPRVDVFSYNAWQAKGRQVQRGQKGVKLTTWIACKGRENSTGERERSTRPKSVSVFHVSQTEAIGLNLQPVIDAMP